MLNTINILSDLRVRIRDEGKIEIGDDNVLIPYINEAISWLNNQLILLQDPSMIKESDVTDNTVVPDGFVKLVGQHPLCRTGNIFKILDGSTTVSARYWANKSRITSVEDTLNFTDQYYDVLVQYATIATLNKLGKPISQDSELFKQLNDLFVQARKAG